MGTTKVTFNLPDEEVEMLRSMANRRRKTMTEVLRGALRNEQFFEEQENAGGTILVQDADKSMSRIRFTR
jgi:hypothetical protein